MTLVTRFDTPASLRDLPAGSVFYDNWHAYLAAGLVTTAGEIEARPGAGNVIPGEARVTLDVRHAEDNVRANAVARLLEAAQKIGDRRGLTMEYATRLDQAAVGCDHRLLQPLEQSVAACRYPVHRMVSGAGHDAMIMAQKMPVAMLFLRSPGGVSHHPGESVLPGDIEAALQTGLTFLENLT